MNDLKEVLSAMKEANERWNADVVDDPEEMFNEYPEFLSWAIPILEKYVQDC